MQVMNSSEYNWFEYSWNDHLLAISLLKIEDYHNFCCYLYYNFHCYQYTVVASVAVVESGCSAPAFSHRVHRRRLRECRLWGENPGGVECKENGSSYGQDPHLTLIYLPTVHMQCSQVQACAHVAVSYYWLHIKSSAQCSGEFCKFCGEARRQRPGYPRCGWDSSTWLATRRIKSGINPLTPRTFCYNFLSHWIQSEVAQGWNPQVRHPGWSARLWKDKLVMQRKSQGRGSWNSFKTYHP